MDILEGANSLGGVGVYLGKGDGTFVLASVIPFGSSTDMALGDFNHDGKPDIATSSNQMALGNGDGAFQPPTWILADPPNLGFAWIAAGDLNNDGWTDLMATQPSYCCGAVYVLLNNQQGGFTLATIADSDAPTSIMLADVNADGNLDAVVAEDGDATAHIYMGNGFRRDRRARIIFTIHLWTNFRRKLRMSNGDGILDLLLPGEWQHRHRAGDGERYVLRSVRGGSRSGRGSGFCPESARAVARPGRSGRAGFKRRRYGSAQPHAMSPRYSASMKLFIAGLALCCSALTAAVEVPRLRCASGLSIRGWCCRSRRCDRRRHPGYSRGACPDSVSTRPGNGNGSFRNAVNTPVQWLHMSGGSLADLNGDGKADLVIGGSPEAVGDGGIGVLLSNGDGTFPQPVFYKVNDGALGNAVVGDFNGDGIPDVAAGGTKGIWFFKGKGDGTFHAGFLAVATPSQALWSGAADFNGDGKLDLAVSAYPSGVYMLFGKGNGTFKQPVVLGDTGWGYLAVGDVTRSAVPDIVLPAAAGASTAVVYINNGKGTFGTPVDVTLTGASVAIGDVNGDGLPDLVSGEGCVALGLGLARFATQVCYPVANNPETLSVVLAELNKGKAGFNDVITGLNHTVSVLINWGNGKFVDGLWIPVAGSGNCAASADFNADGKPDLGVPSTNGIAVLLGTGKALQPYSAGLTVPLSGPGCPITGDVNGDGRGCPGESRTASARWECIWVRAMARLCWRA